MKIVQINTVIGSGSVGRITTSLYEKSVESGMQAIVFYGRGQTSDHVNAIKIGNQAEVIAHVFRNFFRGESGFGSTRATRQLLSYLEQESPDIIHLHNIHGFYLNIELLFQYIKEKNKKVVWTLHDCWPITGHCAYFDYVKCEKWKTKCHHCVQYRTAYPYALFKDNSSHNYERKKQLFQGVSNLTIVTPSTWLKEIVKQSYLKEYPVEVIPNGIDLSVFQPGKRENKKTKIVLGVANVWEKRKGLIYFEELAKRLDHTYEIQLIGLNKRQQSVIKKKIKKGLLPDQKIQMISKRKNASELAMYYQKADVYVNTTLEDNFPTTNLEALACGTPVITFQTGGSPEAIDEYTGVVIEQGNIEQLVAAIQTMSIHRDACRIRAELYQKEKRFDEYIKLYQRI